MSILIIFALAAALLVMQRYVYGIFWRKDLEADAWFDCGAVTEGETTVLNEMVVNAKWLPLPVVHFLLQTDRQLVFNGESKSNTTVSDQNYRIDVYSLMPWQKITRRLTFCAEKRGYYPVRELSLECRDLFFKKFPSSEIPVNTWLYVYPKLVFTEELDLIFQRMMGEILIRRRLLEDPYAFSGIREYQTYDTMRQINWKATARTGELRVNSCQSTVSCTVSLLLDVRLPRIAEAEERVEQCIRTAAAFGVLCNEAQIPFALYTNGMDKDGNTGYLGSSTGDGHMQNFMELLAGLDVMATDRRERKLVEEELQAKELYPDTDRGWKDQERVILGSSRYFTQYVRQEAAKDSVFVYFSADEGDPFWQCQRQLDCFWLPVKDTIS